MPNEMASPITPTIEVRLTEDVVDEADSDLFSVDERLIREVQRVVLNAGARVPAGALAMEISYGYVHDEDTAKVSCPTAGRVAKLLVSAGASVVPGQALFVLEPDGATPGTEFVRAGDRLSSLALTVTGECSGCFSVIPIEKFARETRCPGCSAVFSIEDVWAEVFSSIYSDAYAIARGLKTRGEPHRLERPRHGLSTLEWGVTAQLPACACGRLFALEDLSKGALSGSVACLGCGQQATLRLLSRDQQDRLRSFTAEHRFKCEVESFVDLPQVSSPERSVTVDVKCSNCGAELRVDGSSRTVHCQFCNGTQVLAADVWSRIRPVAKVHPFFFLFRPDLARIRQQEEMERLARANQVPDVTLGQKIVISLIGLGWVLIEERRFAMDLLRQAWAHLAHRN